MASVMMLDINQVSLSYNMFDFTYALNIPSLICQIICELLLIAWKCSNAALAETVKAFHQFHWFALWHKVFGVYGVNYYDLCFLKIILPCLSVARLSRHMVGC